MKKKNLLILYFLALTPINGCKSNSDVDLTFTQREYQLKTGEKIEVKENYNNVKYQIVNNPFDNISLNENSGIFTFDDTIPNYTQVMAIATYKEFVSEPCIVTLTYDYRASDVHFTNMSSYIVNNEYVNAVSSKNYSVKYELKEKVDGISVESETGKITFAPIVKNGTSFKVIADSHGSKSEKEFIAMTEGFVEAITSRQALEKNNPNVSAFYPLDFSKSSITNGSVIAVVDSLNNLIDKSFYKYDKKNKRLEILPSILSTLNIGSNTFKIITERNSVSITLDVITKYINTVEDLVSINSSEENLSGYYILMNDLDLTDYLAKEGNNDGKGWTPIGLYTDTLDTNIATQYSFKGTFDGNGHVISGLYANRKDTASFNAGLFGYTTSSSTICNLGVEGELTVSSYSGGFVGSNNGIIENCWSNVKMIVDSGENAYRYVGGFVGNNFGTIKNCYSIGDVKCDTYYGSFVGSNTGFIENCYSVTTENSDKFIGFGTVDKSCVQFDSEQQMKEFDFSKKFDSTNWEFTSNNLPKLKPVLTEYNLRGLNIVIENKRYFKGDVINFAIEIYPKSLEDQYKNYVKVKVNESDGFIRSSNSIYTEYATTTACNIEASITLNNQSFSQTKIIYVYDKITSLEFTNNLEYLEAGKRYALSCNTNPSNVEGDNITYHLQSRYLGAEIKDNILTLDDEFALTSISIYATSDSGLKSNTITIPVKTQKIVNSGVVTLYENENTNLEFEFDSSLNLNNAEVKVFNKKVDYQVSNNKIIVSRSVLESSKDMKARFIFNINNDTYGIDTYYFSHERYTVDTFKNEDVIYINSIEDFYSNFNIDPSKEYDDNKASNYNKTFVLTTDLDFEGKEIYAIGHGDNKFSGKFYGMGHTISNFKIKNNEKILVENSTSCYYGVGLFAALSGSIYDLTLRDANITGRNFAGGFVGMLSEGYLENCQAFNLKVIASDYEYSSEDIKVGKVVGKVFSGQVICVYHDNASLNTIG